MQDARQLSLIGGIVFVLAGTGCPTLRGTKRCTQNARTCVGRDVNESAIPERCQVTSALQSKRLGANQGESCSAAGPSTTQPPRYQQPCAGRSLQWAATSDVRLTWSGIPRGRAPCRRPFHGLPHLSGGCGRWRDSGRKRTWPNCSASRRARSRTGSRTATRSSRSRVSSSSPRCSTARWTSCSPVSIRTATGRWSASRPACPQPQPGPKSRWSARAMRFRMTSRGTSTGRSGQRYWAGCPARRALATRAPTGSRSAATRLRCIVGHIVRELVGVLTLSMLLAPGVAVAQDVAVSLGELLHAGSLQPGEGVYVTQAAGRRLKGTLSDVSSAGLVVTQWRPGVDGGRRRRAANRAPGPVGEWSRLRNGDGGRFHLSGLLCRRK